VATDVGGVAEALGDAGIIVPPRSPERVAEAIIRLLKDVSLRLTLGQRSRERVLSYFQIKHLLNGYQDVYNELRSISQTS
jgi:glycosyltransferase involved in cell wall biosynthesis